MAAATAERTVAAGGPVWVLWHRASGFYWADDDTVSARTPQVTEALRFASREDCEALRESFPDAPSWQSKMVRFTVPS